MDPLTWKVHPVSERAAALEALEAVKSGDVDRLRSLVAVDPQVAGIRDDDGLSILLHARYRDHADLVQVLLDAGIQLDVFEAAAVGATQRLAELLKEDASAVDAWSVDGYTPLHLAAFFGHVDAVRLLLEGGANTTAVSRNPMEVMPLHSAVAGADVSARRSVTELLLDHGADVDARTHGGFTALMEAAQNGDLGVVQLLLARGADPALESDQGKSAEDLSTGSGHISVADALRNRG